jgi:UDP-glucose 6-dehydrogenase
VLAADNGHYSTLDNQETPIVIPSDTVSRSGFNRIVSFGYAEKDQYRLPRSRSCKNISVLGLGHQGTISAIGFAALGHMVIGVDHDHRKVNALNQGRTYSSENGLQELLSRVAQFNNLVATDDSFNAVRHTEITLICVGNNTDRNGEFDTTSLMTACEQLATTIKDKSSYHLFIWCHSDPSKICCKTMIEKIENGAQKLMGKDFGFCTVQRPLRKQQMIEDFYHPEYITISSDDKNSADLAVQIFNDFDTKIRHRKL